jgi:hypothetical protein
MAKKRAKRTKARREIINDPALPLLSGVEAVTPVPSQPLLATRQRAWNRERAAWQAEQRALAAARMANDSARLAGRPSPMKDTRYRLPAAVASWLRRTVWAPWYVPHHDCSTVGIDDITKHHGIDDAMLAAFMEGCRQGYIEGRAADIEPKRERSRKANAARREKHNLDDRDAEIVEKYRRLRAVPLSAGEAQFRLADEYGLSDKMIRIIIGKANRKPQ